MLFDKLLFKKKLKLYCEWLSELLNSLHLGYLGYYCFPLTLSSDLGRNVMSQGSMQKKI